MNKSANLLYDDIRAILTKARAYAYHTINSAMVEAYWLMGKRIVEEEQHGSDRAQRGAKLIKNLSIALGKEFGKGFSVANLKNFRQFYLTFPQGEKGYTLCSQSSWSQVRLIMRLEDANAREYYLKESNEQNWSVRQLERNIHSNYFVQKKERNTGQDHAAQRRQYSRKKIPALFAEQGRIAEEVIGMGAGMMRDIFGSEGILKVIRGMV